MSAKTKRNSSPKRIASPPRREPTHDEIALCAMTIWEAEGRPQGRELEHWLLAESRLRQGCKPDADAGMRGDHARRSSQSESKRAQPEAVVF